VAQTLDECWNLWIAKARELKAANIPCCAPFFSAKPEGFDASTNRILLVGKATAGWYWKNNGSLSSGLSDKELALEQVQANLDVRSGRVEERKPNRGFWNFMLKAASSFGDNDPNPKNLIWSNLFKIGSESGNPSGRLAEYQKTLAIQLEIATYAPTIVIFTTAYQSDLVYRIAGMEHQHEWISENEGLPTESWALRLPLRPPMLWTRHPARKSANTLAHWLERAVSL